MNHVIPIKYEWQDNAENVNQYFIVQNDVKMMIGGYIQNLVMFYAKDISGFMVINVLSVGKRQKSGVARATVLVIAQQVVN